MAIEYVNRRGDTYYLHQGKTKTGKPTYFFSRKKEGTLAEAIPGRLNKLEGVVHTATHIAFQTYSRHDLEAAFSLGLPGAD